MNLLQNEQLWLGLINSNRENNQDISHKDKRTIGLQYEISISTVPLIRIIFSLTLLRIRWLENYDQ